MMQELLTSDAQLVSYGEPESWCSIAYYEMNKRVGELFNAKTTSLKIDGFTSPLSLDRFCVGFLTNVNRTAAIEKIRMLIGRGVHLYNIGGEVFIECLSEAPVFVQSQIANMCLGVPQSAVIKVPSNCKMRIFNNQEFASHLAQSVNFGYDAVHQLMGMCTLRLSFVKGWGQSHHSRQAISSCPCWIEIRLTGPLQWLDRVITHMGSPGAPCSSIS